MSISREPKSQKLGQKPKLRALNSSRLHEINEKNYQTKIVIRKDQVKNTQKCTYLSFIRVVAGRKKPGIKNKARDLQLRLNICSLSLQRNQQQ